MNAPPANSGQRGRGQSSDKQLHSKESSTGFAAASTATTSATTAKASSAEKQVAGLPPKGRRSLVKGTPKKSLTTLAATANKLGTTSNDSRTGEAADTGAGGRSLRASTLVVKKASDIDAKQREQFKHKGRHSSANALSTDI